MRLDDQLTNGIPIVVEEVRATELPIGDRSSPAPPDGAASAQRPWEPGRPGPVPRGADQTPSRTTVSPPKAIGSPTW